MTTYAFAASVADEGTLGGGYENTSPGGTGRHCMPDGLDVAKRGPSVRRSRHLRD